MPVSYDFSRRTAVVTGGSKGIGRAIAERLLGAGARVWSWDLEPTTTGPLQHVTVDVTDSAQISAALARVLSESGGIDIVVNNAGFTGGTRSVEELDPADWRRIVDVNLTGVFEVSRQVVPVMRRAGWGRIVNIASLAGKEGTPGLSAYSAAKAGVIALTKSLGKELARENIGVNCITPAAAKTRIFEQMSQSHLDWMLSKIPRGRFLQIEELASLTAWLASEENSFSTGAVFDISGGRSTY